MHEFKSIALSQSISEDTDVRAQFDVDGYAVLHHLIHPTEAAVLWTYLIRSAEQGAMRGGDAQAPGTPNRYGDPTMDRVLERLTSTIATITRLRLAPTYSYLRLYKHGDCLARHVDRPACEISVTMNLGQEPKEPWPIGICGRHGERLVQLAPGDALIYRGMECPHWRDSFRGDRLGQVFLHYVDLDGPHQSWKYDRREALAHRR
jgi:hypothetical protein